MECPLQNKVFK